MDAYDEDPRAARGPDGSAGARPPEKPEAPENPGGPESSGTPESSATSEGSDHESTGQESTGQESAGHELSGQEPPEPPSHQLPATVPDPARRGLAALSPRYQAVAALAVAVIGVGVGVHLLMVFLSLAPQNTVSKQHGKAVEAWVFPEFEQNWKLFAPNPLQQNIAVQVRADVRMKDGSVRTTGWTDLSAQDGAAIKGNPAPSHTQQNELRRAWDFVTATHTADNRPVGMRGALSEEYLRRIAVMRLYRTDPTSRTGIIQRVQVRSRTINVQPPSWSGEQVPDKPVYRMLPWWTVSAVEAAGGVR
ncbi:DUF5819 family protein [Streptomyces murinus]|uniref:Uncharacterized protein n=1 Tax=Streptomyces murinus TaxID=33900 RepID=A0A7W3NQD1_STRMR|nr:DUF5819 family protein [Streptomyces murinus]MBA9054800.1 hypothetical protein [Streptomyces murinus]UWW89463.1 hypothetical protein GO605_00295 [Streptomyces murinus]